MVGRVGAKAMTWFITASLTSLLIGLVLVNIMKPGEGTDIVMNVSDAGDLLKHKATLRWNTLLTIWCQRVFSKLFPQTRFCRL